MLCVRKGRVFTSDKEKLVTGEDKIIILHNDDVYAFVRFIIEQSVLRNTNVSKRQ